MYRLYLLEEQRFDDAVREADEQTASYYNRILKENKEPFIWKKYE